MATLNDTVITDPTILTAMISATVALVVSTLTMIAGNWRVKFEAKQRQKSFIREKYELLVSKVFEMDLLITSCYLSVINLEAYDEETQQEKIREARDFFASFEKVSSEIRTLALIYFRDIENACGKYEHTAAKFTGLAYGWHGNDEIDAHQIKTNMKELYAKYSVSYEEVMRSLRKYADKKIK